MRPVRRKENTLKSQWELKIKTSQLPKAQENSSDQFGMGFSFASDYLRESSNQMLMYQPRVKKQDLYNPVESLMTFHT